MDVSGIDFSPGISFSTKVRSLLHAPVASLSPGKAPSFSLIAAFGRCRFRLSEESAGILLQSVLGSSALDFCVTELEDRIFKFWVSSKHVGFLIYDLRKVECANFKLFFHLCNDRGFSLAKQATVSDQQPKYEWVTVQRKANNRTFAEVAKANAQHNNRSVPVPKVFNRLFKDLHVTDNKARNASAPLSDANAIPLNPCKPWGKNSSVFSRIDSNDLIRNMFEPAKNMENLNYDQRSSVPNVSQGVRNYRQVFGSHLNLPPNVHCSRCLADTHNRAKCTSKIKCFACKQSGHIAVNCFSKQFASPPKKSAANHAPGAPLQRWLCTWFRKARGLSDTEAVFYSSFSDFGSRNLRKQGFSVTIPWIIPSSANLSMTSGPNQKKFTGTSPMASGPNRKVVHDSPSNDDFSSNDLTNNCTKATSQSSSPPIKSTVFPATLNPIPLQLSANNLIAMAFRCADPRPFLPQGFDPIWVPNRVKKVRSVVPRRPPTHEDFAIVSINPMPAEEVAFPAIAETLREFFEDHMRLSIIDIQPCHLGQAYVRFENVYDRDNLVLNSPIPYAGGHIIVQKHNEGRNWRAVQFNREVWLMLMGFPLDYWNQDDIEQAIGYFARLISWEHDTSRIARLIVKARVVDLESIPQFIVFTDGDEFCGNSWTIQCEIMQQQLLGGQPGDEDQDPDNNDGPDPPPYDFHGYGQSSDGPPVQHQAQHNPQPAQQQNDVAGWPAWNNAQPDAAPAAQVENGNNEGIDLNENHVVQNVLLDNAEFNLNADPEAQNEMQHDFIPVPDLNEAEIVELENINLQMNPAVQMAQALNLPNPEVFAYPLQFDDETVSISDISSTPDSNSSVNMETPGVILGLPVQGPPVQLPHEPHNPDGPPLQLIPHGPFLPEEMQGDALISENEMMIDNAQMQVNNIHIGRAQIFNSFSVDHGVALNPDIKRPAPDTFRLWARLFTSPSSSFQVSIPDIWSNFFTSLLVSPTHYDWAKKFLQSKEWEFIASSLSSGNSLQFSIPASCPNHNITCLEYNDIAHVESQQIDSNSASKGVPATPEKRKSQRKAGISIIDPDGIRKSERIKNRNKGFRRDSCTNRNCLACTSEPPTLPSSIIRNLGATFCQMNPQDISIAALSKKKPRAKSTIQKPAKMSLSKRQKVASQEEESLEEEVKVSKPKAKGKVTSKKTKKTDDESN